jgi:lipopolysaccharide export system permease protein
MSPFSGMWMATLIMVPMGIFLTYKAMHDSQLLNKEYYFRMGKKLHRIFKKEKVKSVSLDIDISKVKNISDQNNSA